jgi:hypothetical protein
MNAKLLNTAVAAGVKLGKLTVCSAIIGGFVVAPSYADSPGRDWKGYSAVGCLSSGDASSVHRSVTDVSTSFGNLGTSTMTVHCPVVRDEAEGGNNRVAAVRVYLRNRNSSADAKCEFSSRTITGEKFDSASGLVPRGSGYGTIDLGPVNASNWGSYTLTCQLPGRDPTSNLPSYIVNYRVDEAS